MGKPKTWENGITANSDAVYTDALGVQWKASRGMFGQGLLRTPWSKWTARIITTNPYGLSTEKVYYTEDSRDALQAKIDDMVYAYRVAHGDLQMAEAHPQARGDGGAFVFVLVLVFAVSKKGR